MFIVELETKIFTVRAGQGGGGSGRGKGGCGHYRFVGGGG